MSPRFKGQWRPSLFKLMLMIGFVTLMLTLITFLIPIDALKTRENRGNDSQQRGALLQDVDPMEPCYLANNRASESLTISESTPVGTVVGELLVSIENERIIFNQSASIGQ